MDFVTPFFEWLLKCDYIKNNPIFANAIQAGQNKIEVVTEQVNQNEIIEYVDGTRLLKVRFTIFNFKSFTFQQLIQSMIANNENIENLLDVGKICDYVTTADESREYPDFGTRYEVQRIYPQYLTPSSPTVDNTAEIMRYSVPIVCEVFDNGANLY